MESGKIPDITIYLPEGQILNLDVKFPLNNYMRYLDVLEKEVILTMILNMNS